MNQMSDNKVFAYQANETCFQPGLKPNQVAERYDAWSTSYDQMMVGTYNGPQMAVEEILGHVPAHERATSRVLDIGAGTGQVGLMLTQVGFRHVDAVEPSLGMLRKLRERGVYGRTYEVYLGCGDTTIPPGTYDVVVVVGGMGENHLPVASIDDMISVSKPGGFVVIVMRKEYMETVEAYRGKLEPHLDSLEERRYWIKVTRKVVPNYFCDKDGLIMTYKVL